MYMQLYMCYKSCKKFEPILDSHMALIQRAACHPHETLAHLNSDSRLLETWKPSILEHPRIPAMATATLAYGPCFWSWRHAKTYGLGP